MTGIARRWHRLRIFLAQKVLHADDSPHAIALGAGIATLIAILPLVGLQMLIAIGLAALFRANKAICIPIVWITNPITMGPMYYGCYRLGRVVLPAAWSGDDQGLEHLVSLAKTASLFDATFWKDILQLLAGAGLDLWVGCAVAGTVLGIAAYFVVRGLIVGYRERRRQRALRRTVFRPTRLAPTRSAGTAD